MGRGSAAAARVVHGNRDGVGHLGSLPWANRRRTRAMSTHDIIVVGASAGGVEALSALVGGLPPDLPAAVFVVLHLPQNGTSVLPQILSHAGPLPATHPVNGQAIQDGRIYVAPPDHHLLVRKG